MKSIHYIITIILGLCLSIMSAKQISTDSNPRKEKWAIIESNIKQQKDPKTTLKLCQSLLKDVEQGNFPDEKVKLKLLIHHLNYEISDDTDYINHDLINQIDKDIESMSFPYNSYMALIGYKLVEDYYITSSWEIKQRKNTNFSETDFSTWKADDFDNKIKSYKDIIYSNKEQLNAIDIESIPHLFIQSHLNQTYIKTAHQSILFLDLQNQKRRLYDEQLSSLDIEDAFTGLTNNQSLQTYINDFETYKNLFTNEIKIQLEMEFWSHLISLQNNPKIKDIYVNNLSAINTYNNPVLKAEKNYRLALFYYNGANDINWNGLKNIEDIRLLKQKKTSKFNKSISFLNKIISNSHKQNNIQLTEITNLSNNLHSKITKDKTLLINGKNTQTSNKDLIFDIQSRNIDKLNLEVYKINSIELHNLSNKLNWNQKQQILSLLKNKSKVWSGSYDITYTSDFVEDKRQIVIPSLDYGIYAIALKNDLNKFFIFQVTDLYVEKDKSKITVKSAKNYSIIKNATLCVGTDNNKCYPFDKKGKLIYSSDKNIYRNIIHGKDSYYISNQSFHSYDHHDNNYVNYKDAIFTDRAIYRPGQTVHIKVIQKQKKQKDLLYSLSKTNKIDITLKNVQYEDIQQKTIALNEYSSGYTSFVIPKGSLNGRYTINTAHGRQTIQVEEYKRPTFYINFHKDSTEKRIGDIIKIPISAKTYSGISLNNAKIQYSITYQNMPTIFWKCGYYNWSESFILNHQNTTLNKEGKFIIEVNTNDLPASMKEQNVVQFNIEVKVIDINGDSETETNVFTLSNNGITMDPLTNLSTFEGENLYPNIKLNNFQNIPIQKEISYIIWKLKEPKHILQHTNSPSENTWLTPIGYSNAKGLEKTSILNKASYDQWETIEQIKSGIITANKETEIKTNLTTGVYKVTYAVEDQKGNTVSRTKYLKVFPKKGKTIIKDENIVTLSKQWEYKVNDTYEKTLYLPFPSQYYYVISDFQGVLQSGCIKGESIHKVTQKIKSRSKGGIVLDIKTVYNNKLYQYSVHNPVNWEMHLNTKWVTLRNKIQPQSQEKWSLKITNYNGETEDLEALAFMYDASLDKIKKHSIKHNVEPLSLYKHSTFLKSQVISNYFNSNLQITNNVYHNYILQNLNGVQLEPTFNYLSLNRRYNKVSRALMANNTLEMAANDMQIESDNNLSVRGGRSIQTKYLVDGVKVIGTPAHITPNQDNKDVKQIQIRKNFKETVFFYPELYPNADGIIDIPFTMTDGVGSFKLMLYGFTKSLKQFYLEEDIISNKELMVEMHKPRFLYSGDKIIWTAKVSNLSDTIQHAKVKLKLTNPINSNLIFQSDNTQHLIKVQPGESKSVRWETTIPKNLIGEIAYELHAETEKFIDIEIDNIPVLTTKKRIYENFALTIPANQSKSYRLSELLNASNFEQFKLECISNPIWNVIKALPYSKSTDDKIISNILDEYISIIIGKHILNKNPNISQRLLELSKSKQTSPLREKETLKAITLEESPWLVDAKNQEEDMLLLANFFDENNIKNRLSTLEHKLKKHQNSSGGFSWIKGGKDSYSMSLYVAKSLSTLEKLGLEESNLSQLKRKLVNYLDQQILADYKRLKRNKTLKHVKVSHVSYLEARTYFLNSFTINKDAQVAFDFFLNQTIHHWTNANFVNRISIASIAHGNGKMKIFDEIFKTLDEYKIHHEEQHSMYWKHLANGLSWQNRKLVNHADLIHIYKLHGNKDSDITKLQNWLLQQKRSQHWGSSSETSQIIYALLLNVNDTKIFSPIPLDIKLNGKPLSFQQTKGWLSKTWTQEEQFDIEHSILEITNGSNQPIWISGHQQYFSHISEVISDKNTICSIEKVFYKHVIHDGKEEWIKTDLQQLEIGDEVKVNMTLDIPQTLDFVYIQDYFGACFEPVDRISGFKYNRNGSYYLNIKDQKMQFFFDRIARGSHEFEFVTRIKQRGEFSNGFAEFQSYYAPEFGGHSKAQKTQVNE